MSEDERAIRERLAALEREVKAEASARKQAVEPARPARAVNQAPRPSAAKASASAAKTSAGAAKALPSAAKGSPSARKALPSDAELEAELAALEELAAPSARQSARTGALPDVLGDVGGALDLARRAQGVKAELTRPVKKGEKSWPVSAGLSAMLGPVGWLYAGSWREAAPAAAAWVALGYLLSFLPTMLLLPMLIVAMPLSGLAGAMYALGYNRAGKRQRLFGDNNAAKRKKALDIGDGE